MKLYETKEGNEVHLLRALNISSAESDGCRHHHGLHSRLLSWIVPLPTAPLLLWQWVSCFQLSQATRCLIESCLLRHCCLGVLAPPLPQLIKGPWPSAKRQLPSSPASWHESNHRLETCPDTSLSRYTGWVRGIWLVFLYIFKRCQMSWLSEVSLHTPFILLITFMLHDSQVKSELQCGVKTQQVLHKDTWCRGVLTGDINPWPHLCNGVLPAPRHKTCHMMSR